MSPNISMISAKSLIDANTLSSFVMFPYLPVTINCVSITKNAKMKQSANATITLLRIELTPIATLAIIVIDRIIPKIMNAYPSVYMPVLFPPVIYISAPENIVITIVMTSVVNSAASIIFACSAVALREVIYPTIIDRPIVYMTQ